MFKRKTIQAPLLALVALVLLSAFPFRAAAAQESTDEMLMQEAKVRIFDEKWAGALEKLDTLLNRHPESPWASQALFYRAKCLSKISGREGEALQAFKEFLKRKESQSLAEEAEVSIIELAASLVHKGRKSYAAEITERLKSPHKVIRYYAAFELSYFKDKAVAVKSLSVLKDIVKNEKDPELQDRAKIALLRVDPASLKEVETARGAGEARILRIQIIEKGEIKLNINIPWALADLALQAIPERDRLTLKTKGYDLDKIVRELQRTKSSILEIKDEDSLIKIWID